MLKNFTRGDTKLIKLRIRDKDDSPVDISDWVLYVSFKISPLTADSATGNVSVKIDLNETDLLGLKYRNLSAPQGTVTLRIGPELTKTLIGGETYYYDIQRVQTILGAGGILSDHDVWTLVSGQVKIVEDVTKSYSAGTLGQVPT